MEVHRSTDVEVYAAAASEFLDSEPCRRNLLRGVIDSVRRAAVTLTGPATYWWVVDGDAVVAAASWTPPHALMSSTVPDAVVTSMVESALQRAGETGQVLPGVIGHQPGGGDEHAIGHRQWGRLRSQRERRGPNRLTAVSEESPREPGGNPISLMPWPPTRTTP